MHTSALAPFSILLAPTFMLTPPQHRCTRSRWGVIEETTPAETASHRRSTDHIRTVSSSRYLQDAAHPAQLTRCCASGTAIRRLTPAKLLSANAALPDGTIRSNDPPQDRQQHLHVLW